MNRRTPLSRSRHHTPTLQLSCILQNPPAAASCHRVDPRHCPCCVHARNCRPSLPCCSLRRQARISRLITYQPNSSCTQNPAAVMVCESGQAGLQAPFWPCSLPPRPSSRPCNQACHKLELTTAMVTRPPPPPSCAFPSSTQNTTLPAPYDRVLFTKSRPPALLPCCPPVPICRAHLG